MSNPTPSEFENRVKTLAGLSDTDIAAFTVTETKTEDDLSWLEFDDLPDTISIVKRREIEMISKFMNNDDSSRLLRNTSLKDIRKAVREKSKRASAVPASSSSQSSNNNIISVARNAPEITTGKP